MKRFAITVLIVLLISTSAFAEYEEWSAEALQEKKDSLVAEINEKYEELKQINAAIGEAKKQEELSSEGEKISDIFPDENFAMYIRDKLAKFSISQTATQEELDRIKTIDVPSSTTSLVGVGRLRNLTWINMGFADVVSFPDEMRNCTKIERIYASFSDLTSLPDWIGEFKHLSYIDINYTSIDGLPDSIGDLPALYSLDIKGCHHITSLPERIGNCSSLKYLDAYNSGLESLPDSIGNLSNLYELNIGQTNITSLPDSIWNLSLGSLNMEGLPIK